MQPRSTAAKWLLLVAFAAAMASLAPIAEAGTTKGNPGVLPPQSNAYGATYPERHAEWWQWLLSFPWYDCPNFVEGPYDASVGQTNHVCLLAGAFGGEVERTTTIPAGTPLFLPLVNWVWVSYPEDPPWDEPFDGYPTFEEYVRTEILAAPMDTAFGMCDVDGKAVDVTTAFRAQSPTFMVELPEDNLFDIPAGTYGPCADDGYYLLLAPLSVGAHVIHFTGVVTFGSENPDEWFVVDVTYNVTVECAADH